MRKKKVTEWNAAENTVEGSEWQRKNTFRYKQNGQRGVPRKQLKQHFVSEYALFKVGCCPLAGTV